MFRNCTSYVFLLHCTQNKSTKFIIGSIQGKTFHWHKFGKHHFFYRFNKAFMNRCLSCTFHLSHLMTWHDMPGLVQHMVMGCSWKQTFILSWYIQTIHKSYVHTQAWGKKLWVGHLMHFKQYFHERKADLSSSMQLQIRVLSEYLLTITNVNPPLCFKAVCRLYCCFYYKHTQHNRSDLLYFVMLIATNHRKTECTSLV